MATSQDYKISSITPGIPKGVQQLTPVNLLLLLKFWIAGIELTNVRGCLVGIYITVGHHTHVILYFYEYFIEFFISRRVFPGWIFNN